MSDTGTGCACPSCTFTQKSKGWPCGDPKGARVSNAEYAAHVAHGRQWGMSADGRMSEGPAIPASLLTLHSEARFPAWVTAQCVMPIPRAPAWVRRAINPGVRIDADDVPEIAAPAAQVDNVVARQSPRVRAVRQIAPAVAALDVRALLERAIAARGEGERRAA